jgi:hypothetical protein
MRHNFVVADEIAQLADHKSPQVAEFLNWMNQLRVIQHQL